MGKKGKQILIIIATALLLLSIVLIISQSNQSLQNELNSLESELSNSGYGWLVNSEIFIKLNLSIKGDLSL